MASPRTPWRPRRERDAARETAWSASKKAFATTLVAIALNPVSAAIGYYMNYWLQRAEFGIASVNFVYDIRSREFPQSAWDALHGNPDILARLRETLTKLAADPKSASCVAWLEKRSEWHDECAPVVHNVIASFISMDNRELTALREAAGERAGARAAAPAEGREAALERHLRELESLERVVQTLGAAPVAAQRTGDVTFEVGVLNSGDKDGVIANHASLSTPDGTVRLATDNYTTVKAHSVAYIPFHTAAAGDPEALERFRARVRNGERTPIAIVLDALSAKVRKRLYLETGA